MTSIAVKEENSLWVLEKRYQWKFLRLGWNDPKQELLGVKLQYHSRHDSDHYNQCEDCWADHQDHVQEMEMDARMDAMGDFE